MASGSRAAAVALALGAALGASATARAAWPSGLSGPAYYPTTRLLSRAAGGGLPNGASCCGVISHDQRIARVVAFESTASDIAPGAQLGTPNIYVVRRAAPWSPYGSLWTAGAARLVTRGRGGRPANGPSYAPALSGDSAHPPRCVAFISRASNLVAGDRNRVADAFVANLRTGRVTRVSVGSGGVAADRPSTEVAVTGDCHRVAFVSAATNLAAGARAGRSEVYVRVLHGQHAGSTMIVSAARGRPANRDATELSLSRDGGAVAFASAASNLGGDPRGVTQVWERGLALGSRLRLLSVTPGGRAGDAPSSQPSVDHDGRVVAFVTRATNLLPGANGLAQVVRARTAYARPRLNWISQTGPGTPVGTAASSDPTITDGGAWVFFDAPGASNLTLPGNWTIDRPEVYRWSSPALLASKDTTLLALRSVAEDWAPARTGAWNPDTSARGNYLVFESEDQSLDATLPGAGEPPWYSTNLGDWILPHSWQIVPLPAAPRGALTSLLPGAYGAGPGAGGAATGEPRLHQVYLHYLGPDPHPFDAPGAGGP